MNQQTYQAEQFPNNTAPGKKPTAAHRSKQSLRRHLHQAPTCQQSSSIQRISNDCDAISAKPPPATNYCYAISAKPPSAKTTEQKTLERQGPERHDAEQFTAEQFPNNTAPGKKPTAAHRSRQSLRRHLHQAPACQNNRAKLFCRKLFCLNCGHATSAKPTSATKSRAQALQAWFRSGTRVTPAFLPKPH